MALPGHRQHAEQGKPAGVVMSAYSQVCTAGRQAGLTPDQGNLGHFNPCGGMFLDGMYDGVTLNAPTHALLLLICL
jgi:hypothetical protein